MKHIAILATCILVAFGLEAAGQPATDTADDVVYILPIRGAIEPALLYVIRRGVAEAEASDAAAIIFVMDTPGGTLDAASEIVRTIHKVEVPTYTFVEKDAFSAGAIIALATKYIYMAPGSVIGDAMPIMMTPFGGVEQPSEALQEKMVSGVSALVRSAAEQGGHDTELAEAMVRRELEYKIGDEVICPAGQLLTLTNVEAERLVPERARPLLSEGTVKDLDDLLETIGHQGSRTKELTVTGAERIARFIAALAPVFLMAGLLGLYIEAKTPGFGFPGIIGAVSLAIFFWGHHIAGLAGLEDLMIFVIGVILLLVEILFIPGFGVAGFAGVTLMAWAVLAAMMKTYPGMPWYQFAYSWEEFLRALRAVSYSVVGAAVGGIILGRYLPKSKTFNRLVLSQATTRDEGFTASRSTDDLLGQEGTTQTPLHPAGAAAFGNRKLDVVTRGEYVEAGARIQVIETHGNRVVVEECPSETSGEQQT